ncbi:glycosyltransferase family 4 protein [Pseudoduganella ginsengisoli]|uniref:Glycosyltransferase n=1 Tax=Pseudoduganella ginsengisoli TaxID=1462440 RepID=A0A6L6PSN1_9BURK|nr:glycosyltransferase family 4 protein [Pseudoduganella ginsengisoli]MTW00510.1 glycosyltransferase [Pseudoduganella ginsengisoli]
MRIMLLTQFFEPEPTFKGVVFARKLQELGHEVEVITTFPNYPIGKIYQGYKQKWRSKEVVEGINVVRVPIYASHDTSRVRRSLNYISFAASSLIYGLFFAKKADIIYVYHPPMTVGVVGALIGMMRRIPFVCDIQDLWPDTLRATGMVSSEKFIRFVGHVCQWMYARAAHVVVLSPGFRRRLIERGVPEEKISIIYNWCNESALEVPAESGLDLGFMDGRFNVVFAGNMGKAQALGSVIEAARRVEAENANIQFVFIGGGLEVDALKKQSAGLGITNVRFLPPVPMTEVGVVLERADALLVHLKNDPLFTITIPSKTQAYMAVGKPLLMAVDGDAAELVRESKAGLAIVSEDPHSIAEKVLQLASMPPEHRVAMGQRAKEFYEKELSLDIGCRKFSDLFQRLVFKRRA